ncbi:MAG: glycoside hydrolase family 2, partial [Clostridia bacterium]|nr:glycoside hydrolase family 2 [Clostridia bacterium]
MEMLKNMYPSPDKRRENWLNLNGAWEFSFDEPIFDKTITVPFTWTSPLSGVEEDRKGAGFYRKKVAYQPKMARLFLVIGACDYETKITVNGKELVTHLGGYDPIECEVTDVWKKDAENVIEVYAFDDDSRAHTYGKQGYGNIRGIWQTVYLEERPASYIESFVIRTSLSGDVTIKASVNGKFDSLKAAFEGFKAESKDNELVLKIEEPRLWSPDDPNLYEGTLTLENGEEEDIVHTYFGIREVGSVKCENGRRYFALNGKPIYVNSTLDQSFNPKGFFTLPSDEECENEILRMKALGLNSARIHIKTEEPLKLYYADKHGLMIIQDIPCFWGEPTEEAKSLFDEQMIACMKRDINHPAIVHWVLYNETWGLFSGEGKDRRYLPETQAWVRANYEKAKALDPTRLVEDNSACNYDHVVTDIDTWHFYSNGYKEVKKVIDDFCEKSFVGSGCNYTEGNTLPDIPVMNSECGNVWGIDGNAGDSDMSWHYKYMINEFRLHDLLSGFVFTEFHDVVNEFNGYYRIDNSEKVFGYEEYVPGMTMKDLHAADFLAYDLAPMTTLKAGEKIVLPLYLSS